MEPLMLANRAGRAANEQRKALEVLLAWLSPYGGVGGGAGGFCGGVSINSTPANSALAWAATACSTTALGCLAR